MWTVFLFYELHISRLLLVSCRDQKKIFFLLGFCVEQLPVSEELSHTLRQNVHLDALVSTEILAVPGLWAFILRDKTTTKFSQPDFL